MKSFAIVLLLAAITGCASTSMPNIPNEPSVNKLALNEPRNVALSPFRIKTSQGARTYVSSYFSQRQPMRGWQAGEEYPIATQTVTDELQSMGITVFESMEGLLAPGIRDKLDFLLSGAVQPIRLDIHDTYSGSAYRATTTQEVDDAGKRRLIVSFCCDSRLCQCGHA